MSRLSLKILRDLRQMWVRVLLLSGIVGLGVAIYAAGYMSHAALAHTRDSYFERLRLADLELWTEVADPEELPDFAALPEVAAMVPRFLSPGYLEQADGRPLTLALVYVEPASAFSPSSSARPAEQPPPAGRGRAPAPQRSGYPVNDLEIVAGRGLDAADPYGVVIERAFANDKGLRLGDKLLLNPYHNPLEVTVRGIGIAPEFLIPTSHPDVFIPAKGSLGVVFLPMAIISDTFGAPLYNNLCFMARPGVGEEQLQRAVLGVLAGGLEVKKIIPRRRQYSSLYIDENLFGYILFIPIDVSVFVLVTFLVTLLVIRRLLRQQATELGTLLAMGLTPGRLFAHHLLIGVVVGLLGAAIGVPVSLPLTRLLAEGYGDAMGLPAVALIYPARFLVLGALGGLAVSLLCTALALLPLLRVDPQVAIRGAPGARFGGLPLALQPVLDALALGSRSRRFALRNIFRRPGLAAAIVALIAIAIGTSSAFRVSLRSWEDFAHSRFEQEPWDALVVYRVPLDPAQRAAIEATTGLAQVLPIITGYGTLRDGDHEREMRVLGVVPPKGMRDLRLYDGHLLTRLDADEIIVNGNFNRTHRFETGSQVEFESGKRRRTLTIIAQMDDLTVGAGYVPLQTAAAMLERGDKVDGFQARFAPGADPLEMEKRLYAHEMVAYISLKAHMKRVAMDFMAVIGAIVRVSLVVSYLLAALFIMVGVSLTVMERVAEYATLRALGYGRRLIYAVVYYEVLAEALVALVASVPLTVAIGEYLRWKMGEAWFVIDYHYHPSVLAGIMLPALAFVLLVVAPQVAAVLRVPLAQALRLKSFG